MRYLIAAVACLLFAYDAEALKREATPPAQRAAGEDYVLRSVRPRLTREAEGAPTIGHFGMVTLRIRVGPSGKVTSRRIFRSSGDGYIDALALEVVDRSSPFPALPSILPELELIVPIVFRREGM